LSCPSRARVRSAPPEPVPPDDSNIIPREDPASGDPCGRPSGWSADQPPLAAVHEPSLTAFFFLVSQPASQLCDATLNSRIATLRHKNKLRDTTRMEPSRPYSRSGVWQRRHGNHASDPVRPELRLHQLPPMPHRSRWRAFSTALSESIAEVLQHCKTSFGRQPLPQIVRGKKPDATLHAQGSACRFTNATWNWTVSRGAAHDRASGV
jgi:hypothetical protein